MLLGCETPLKVYSKLKFKMIVVIYPIWTVASKTNRLE